jgi:hypothetical protein
LVGIFVPIVSLSGFTPTVVKTPPGALLA